MRSVTKLPMSGGGRGGVWLFGRLGWPAAHGAHLCFFQAEDGIRDVAVTGVQTCALPISGPPGAPYHAAPPWPAAQGVAGPWLRRHPPRSTAPAAGPRMAPPCAPGLPTESSPRRRGARAREQRTPAAGRSTAHWRAPRLPAPLSPESVST